MKEDRYSPVDWLHQPLHNGMDSYARHYIGFTPQLQTKLLRPSQPVKLNLAEGDLLSLTNTDGATPVLLIPFNERGEHDFASLGLSNNTQQASLPASPDVLRIAQWYDNQGGRAANNNQAASISNLGFKTTRIFDESTPPGELFTVRSTATLTLWILIDPQMIYNAERVHNGAMGGAVHFQINKAAKSQIELPDPLGDIRDEFTVTRGTAKAYELFKGETVQIIDVEGQQCSDFMAMHSASLDKGEERYIDSTVTRSMVRGAYPIPGLFDKFYDQDMRPLLKLKQDTVGRHDTFALACTARGYEERGFFGHLNCSDNISHAYRGYQIQPRSAWPAINFFFNSWIDPSNNVIQSDEAWSRPGDYVALEAMADLVAVNTACPDDVDPINGWNPTDIHVRIYKPTTTLSYAVAYRSQPDMEPILTEHSAFHERTSQLTRQYQVARDLWLPQSYEATRANEEYSACRQAVTIQDMSSLRKFDILGPDAERLLQSALTRDITKLSINRGVYALLCDNTGVVIDDGTLFRLSHDTFRWCCGSDESGTQLKELAEQLTLNVWIKSLYGAMPNLAVQGPKSRQLMQRIAFTQPTMTHVDNLRWFGSTVARLYDREGEPFLLTRTGYTGELGYEIFCHNQSALAIWDALMNEGAELGIKPMGLEALETIRIEAGLMAAGAEFTADVDAYEAGLGFAVDLNKPHFVGKAALERNQLNPRRVLKGLLFKSHEAPSHGDPVMLGRRQVGTITSATVSPQLDCAIAMARLSVEHAQNESELEIGKLEMQGKRLLATVCDIPFIDPTRAKARA